MANIRAYSHIRNKINGLLKNKPGEVFTISEASGFLKCCPNGIRKHVKNLPESQWVSMKLGRSNSIVFGSESAIKKFKSLIK